MSAFTVEAHQLIVFPHEDADRLDVAVVGGYQAVVAKGEFKTGDVALYIPEGAVVPKNILRAMNLWDDEAGKGKLAGSRGDRVKAIRLRGVLSQGLVYRPPVMIYEPPTGVNYAEQLGITKYIAPIPTSLAGVAYTCDGMRGYTDIEDIKKHMDWFQPGEHIFATEKRHGSMCAVLITKDDGSNNTQTIHVASKSFASRGQALTQDEKNTYWQVLLRGEHESIAMRLGLMAQSLSSTWLIAYGEVFGPGIQDLHYGLQQPTFEVFDLRTEDGYWDYEDMLGLCEEHDVKTVPLVPVLTYDYEYLCDKAAANLLGGYDHVQEGLVVRPEHEERIGNERKIVKFINPAYLLRHGGTEHE